MTKTSLINGFQREVTKLSPETNKEIERLFYSGYSCEEIAGRLLQQCFVDPGKIDSAYRKILYSNNLIMEKPSELRILPTRSSRPIGGAGIGAGHKRIISGIPFGIAIQILTAKYLIDSGTIKEFHFLLADDSSCLNFSKHANIVRERMSAVKDILKIILANWEARKIKVILESELEPSFIKHRDQKVDEIMHSPLSRMINEYEAREALTTCLWDVKLGHVMSNNPRAFGGEWVFDTKTLISLAWLGIPNKTQYIYTIPGIRCIDPLQKASPYDFAPGITIEWRPNPDLRGLKKLKRFKLGRRYLDAITNNFEELIGYTGEEQIEKKIERIIEVSFAGQESRVEEILRVFPENQSS